VLAFHRLNIMMINNNPLFRGGLAALLFLSCTAAIFRNNQAEAPQENSVLLQKQHAIQEQTFEVPFSENTATIPEFDQAGAENVRRLGGYGYGKDSDKSSKDSDKSSKDSDKSSKDSDKSSKDSDKSSKDSDKSSKDSSKSGKGKGSDSSSKGKGKGSDSSSKGKGKGSDSSSKGKGKGSDSSSKGKGYYSSSKGKGKGKGH